MKIWLFAANRTVIITELIPQKGTVSVIYLSQHLLYLIIEIDNQICEYYNPISSAFGKCSFKKYPLIRASYLLEAVTEKRFQ